MQPIDLYEMSDAVFSSKLGYNTNQIVRIKRLLDRSGSLSFEIGKYENMGIKIVTRADLDYPKKLKAILNKICPPLFYYAGDLSIADDSFIGFVGSRSVDQVDIAFTEKLVTNITKNEYSIVSGGAKGIDSTATEKALTQGSVAMEFLSDSMTRRIKNSLVNKSIRDGRMLVLSTSKPDSGFNTGMAMARNKLIYANSQATVIIKSDYNKGGTWAGAIEALKNKWSTVYCWENKNYNGNIGLIKNGAIPINSDTWCGDNIQAQDTKPKPVSFFDLIDKRISEE